MFKSKCCDSKCYINEKGNNVGLYCSKCGKWQKWLNKDEINLFNHENENKDNNSDDYYKNKIIELIDSLNKESKRRIEIAYKSIRKNAYEENKYYADVLNDIKFDLIKILEEGD